MNGNKMLDMIGEVKGSYVMEAQKHREGKKVITKRSPRKLLLIAIAATLILATMTGAAVYTRWSRSMDAAYGASQDQKEMAQDMGLSSMLEKKQEPLISATDQGITVTAVQTIVDSYRASITYRIEGFELAEGEFPATAGGITTIDGQPCRNFMRSSSAYFYDGTKRNENNERVYADGTPVLYDEEGCTILKIVASDGSLEYTERIDFAEPGKHLGKEVEANFKGFGHQSGMAESAMDVEGNWTLKWTLTGSDKTYFAYPNAPIGDTGHTLLECEVTPLTIRTKLKTNEYFIGWDVLLNFTNRIVGVRMKDGSINTNVMPGMEGYEDKESLTAVLEVRTMDILDVEQVESILFYKDSERDADGYETNLTFYEVPIR